MIIRRLLVIVPLLIVIPLLSILTTVIDWLLVIGDLLCDMWEK